MWKVPAALVVLGLCSAPASALELKNVRAVYSIFGAARPDNKVLPGDLLHVEFDIVGLKVDEKSASAKYHLSMDMLDSKGGLVFNQKKNNQVTLSLGGNQVPGIAEVLIGSDQAPGKYTLKVTVLDLLAKDTKDFTYAFEVQAESFGFIRVVAPVAFFLGQDYSASYTVTGMMRDARKKPSASIRMRVLDDNGKAVHPLPFTLEIPKDLPEELTSKIETLPFVPLQFPVFLNRVGRFTIEVEGKDNISKKTATLRLPLTVLDPATFASK